MDILAMLRLGASPEEISRTFELNLEAAQKQRENESKQREKENGLIALSENLYKFLCTYYIEDSKNINMNEVKHMFSPRELDGFFDFVLENCKFEEATFSASNVKINEDLLKNLL
jgi:hypothetical protein